MENKKICFYTAIFQGNHFKNFDRPQKFKKIDNCDYKLFTNIERCNFDTSWDIVSVDFPEIKNSILKARKIKHQGYKLLNEYDIVIWCDGYWHPQNNPGIFKILINRCLNSKGGLIISPNPYRNCAYEECDEIVKEKKDTHERMEKLKIFLQEKGLPKNVYSWRTTFMVIDRNNKNSCKLLDNLWGLLKDDIHTYRDQPLLSLAIHDTEIHPEKPDFLLEKAFVLGKRGNHRYT